ncbi:MAG: RMD1 family protein [Gammaproteobacteria bacterium]
MRCLSYCIAEAFNLQLVADHFKRQNYFIKFYRDVLYVKNPISKVEIFILPIGCYVTWGVKSKDDKKLLTELKRLSIKPLNHIEIDHFTCFYGEKTTLYSHSRFNADIILLEDEDVQIKLGISYGLAQSVKLEAYEESVKKTIKSNETFPMELSKTGRIYLSGRNISKRIGEIFLERSSVNLNSEYLDMPEYFWQSPRLETYYVMTEKFLDLSKRVHSLNQRLDVLHGLFEVLQNQLQHRHSNLLEITVILLIFIEIVINFFKFHL